MTREGGLVLGGVVSSAGGGRATSWWPPGSEPQRSLDLEHGVDLTRTLERGGFAVLLVADEPRATGRSTPGTGAALTLRAEPLTLLGALSQRTGRIGLAATVSTTDDEPYHVARKLASLDVLSGGRAAWSPVASASEEEARTVGGADDLDHAARHRRGAEFVDVVGGLWDSWDDDAFLYDQQSGFFARRDGLHVLDHAGEFFRVRGPLNIARPPQGHPVLIQSGDSEAGRALAGARADAVVTRWQEALPEAQALCADHRRRAVEAGRDPASLLVLPAVSPVLGDTEAGARRRVDEIEELTPDRVALDRLSHHLQTDLSASSLDEPFEAAVDRVPTARSTSASEAVRRVAGEGDATLRDLHRTVLRRQLLPGTPEQVADQLTARYEQGAADGYVLALAADPDGVDRFVDQVVPELERRGAYERAYRGTTLREHLGLARPASRWSGRATAAAVEEQP